MGGAGSLTARRSVLRTRVLRYSTAGACVSLAVVVLGSGCASAPESSPSGYEVTFITYIDYLIESAHNQGASSTQLAILDAARESCDVTFKDLDRATQDTFACFEAAGIDYSRSVSDGLDATITYSFSPPNGDPSVADSCILKYSQFVEMAWNSRPAALEADDAVVLAHRNELVACLRKRGAEVEDDATASELRQAAISTPEEEREAVVNHTPTRRDCFLDIGIMNV